MFCSNCGTNNADNAKFCGGCGAPLLAPTPVEPVAPVAPTPVMPPVAPPVVETEDDEKTMVYIPEVKAKPVEPTPVEPVAPVQPVFTPVEPVAPVQPVFTPVEPVAPAQPVFTPAEPVAPVQPVFTPAEPVAPAQPVFTPVEPVAPAQPMYAQFETPAFASAPAPAPKKKGNNTLIIAIVAIIVVIAVGLGLAIGLGVFDGDSKKEDTEETTKNKTTETTEPTSEDTDETEEPVEKYDYVLVDFEGTEYAVALDDNGRPKYNGKYLVHYQLDSNGEVALNPNGTPKAMTSPDFTECVIDGVYYLAGIQITIPNGWIYNEEYMTLDSTMYSQYAYCIVSRDPAEDVMAEEIENYKMYVSEDSEVTFVEREVSTEINGEYAKYYEIVTYSDNANIQDYTCCVYEKNGNTYKFVFEADPNDKDPNFDLVSFIETNAIFY